MSNLIEFIRKSKAYALQDKPYNNFTILYIIKK